MTERSIVEAAARLRRNREPHLVATVVCAHGSAYRRPGARMLLTQFRWIAGSVSGGCLEGDIASKGWWRTRDGDPVVVTYDSRVPEDADDEDLRSAFGLGCDGVVEVMLERAAPGRIDPLAFAEQCLRDQRRAAIVTVFRTADPAIPIGTRIALCAGCAPIGDPIDPAVHDAMLRDATAAIERGESCNRSYATPGGTIETFIEAIVPPPRLFVFGTGHDVIPVVALAHAIGWDVSVCAPQARLATRHRFSSPTELAIGRPDELAERIAKADRAVAVVMAHNYELDRDHLGMLATTQACYIGVLGPRARTTRMLDELGLDAHDDPRLHSPVGLDVGAETPQEIALAIIAEVQSVLRSTPASSLKERIGPIHERAPLAVAV